jgi:hypothetical protein
MYGTDPKCAVAAGSGTAGSLAFTGFHTVGFVVLAIGLLFLGAALVRFARVRRLRP